MFLADRNINPFYYNWRSPHQNTQEDIAIGEILFVDKNNQNKKAIASTMS
jgi:hypothetical protein